HSFPTRRSSDLEKQQHHHHHQQQQQHPPFFMRANLNVHHCLVIPDCRFPYLILFTLSHLEMQFLHCQTHLIYIMSLEYQEAVSTSEGSHFYIFTTTTNAMCVCAVVCGV